MHFVYITWLYWLLGISLFLLSSTIASIACLSQPLSILQSIQSVHRIASLFITLFYCLFWRMLTFGEQSNEYFIHQTGFTAYFHDWYEYRSVLVWAYSNHHKHISIPLQQRPIFIEYIWYSLFQDLFQYCCSSSHSFRCLVEYWNLYIQSIYK